MYSQETAIYNNTFNLRFCHDVEHCSPILSLPVVLASPFLKQVILQLCI